MNLFENDSLSFLYFISSHRVLQTEEEEEEILKHVYCTVVVRPSEPLLCKIKAKDSADSIPYPPDRDIMIYKQTRDQKKTKRGQTDTRNLPPPTDRPPNPARTLYKYTSSFPSFSSFFFLDLQRHYPLFASHSLSCSVASPPSHMLGHNGKKENARPRPLT